jgi:hypothetical protein
MLSRASTPVFANSLSFLKRVVALDDNRSFHRSSLGMEEALPE